MKTLGLLALSLLSFACIDDDDDGNIVATPPVDDIGDTGDDDDTPPAVLEWQATLISTDVFQWQLTGFARVLQTVGNTAFTASISIRNDLPGTARPWHVHFGSCATGGDIVGEDAAYPRLSVDTGGASTGVVTIRDIALDPAALYHVNVHQSNAQLGTLIACGDLILQ